MVQTNPMTKTVGLERSVMPAPADPRTTTESRQSLALDETPPSSLPNIIYGQEPFPLEQYHRKTDEPRSDIVVRYTGNSPRRGGLRRLFNFIRRPRSTGSKKLHKSRIDPEPPSLPPLTLGSSILDDLLHEESPVFQSVLGTPEMPDPEFARMSSVTNGTRGIGTKLQPFEDVYGSPSTMGMTLAHRKVLPLTPTVHGRTACLRKALRRLWTYLPRASSRRSAACKW
ncbi:hypothetical protein EDC04DRAFT_278853 [Pisolithus marmoratus]|nr:hypothetical protein EDC04DRAFT_278853 [Pisolithus marmoratus]